MYTPFDHLGIKPEEKALVFYEGLELETLKACQPPEDSFRMLGVDFRYGEHNLTYGLGLSSLNGSQDLSLYVGPRERLARTVGERIVVTELRKLAFEIRRISGGYFLIHPFSGLVRNTMLPEIEDGVDPILLGNEYLSIDVLLRDEDVKLEGLSYADGQEVLAAMVSAGRGEVSPNVANRKQAQLNGFGPKWDEVYLACNPQARRGLRGIASRYFGDARGIPKAMKVTHASAITLLERLQGISGYKTAREVEATFSLTRDEFDSFSISQEQSFDPIEKRRKQSQETQS